MTMKKTLKLKIAVTAEIMRYYEIIGGYTGEVIGHCTSDGVDEVRNDEPKATLREISRRQYDAATAS